MDSCTRSATQLNRRKTQVILKSLLGVLIAALLSACSNPVPDAPISNAATGAKNIDVKNDWDVTQPRGAYRTVAFETDQGTWMSADYGQDDETVIFDMLGNLYQVKANNGETTCLTCDTKLAINTQPAISPDRERLAFISDRNGNMNLYTSGLDGEAASLVHPDPEIRVSEPVWSPDGSVIVAMRKRNSNRQIGIGLAAYPSIGGPYETLVEGEVGGPAFSPDGELLYYHTHNGAEEKNLSFTDFEIQRITWGKENAQPETVLKEAIAPNPSPDGRYLAFIRRMEGPTEYRGIPYGPRSALWLLDLSSGETRLLLDPVEMDLTETAGDLLQPSRVHPAYNWRDDSEEIIISQFGRLVRVNAITGETITVPFKAKVERELSEMAIANRPIDFNGPIKARFLRWGAKSQKGFIAAQAFGRVYFSQTGITDKLQSVPGAPDDFQFSPVLSPDGTKLAYLERALNGEMSIKLLAPDGKSTETLYTTNRALYNLAWSPDGNELAFTAVADRTKAGVTPFYAPEQRIFTIKSEPGSTPNAVSTFLRAARSRALPAATILDNGQICTTLHRKTIDNLFSDLVCGVGTAAQSVILTSSYVDRIVPTPDLSRIALQKNSDIFLIEAGEFAPGDYIELKQNTDTDAPRARRISAIGGIDPYWRSDGALTYAFSNRVYVYNPNTDETTETVIDLFHTRKAGSGRIAWTGAKIISLGTSGTLDRADLVTENGRIACIGECDLSALDKIVPLDGKTIIPGLVDTHYTVSWRWERMIPQNQHRLRADIAAGTTTGFSPSDWSDVVYPASEMLDAGILPGPRVFSGADKTRWDPEPYYVEPGSIDDMRREVEKRAQMGARGIKQYFRERDRGQRQMLSQAAREAGLSITAHLTKGHLEYGLSLALDGYTATQHTPSQLPLYKDVTEFFGQAGFTHNATVSLAGGIINQSWFFAEKPPIAYEEIRSIIPPPMLLRAPREDTVRPEWGYGRRLNALAYFDMVEAGGSVAAGSHGNQPGLSLHLDIWILADAMGPEAALRSATIAGAEFLGLEEEIGRLEPGMLADFLILNADPLDDIRNTIDNAYTIKNGAVFDGKTGMPVSIEELTQTRME